MARLGQDHQATVAVEVDEAGRDDPAGGIDPAADVRGRRLTRVQDPQPLPVDDDAPRSPGLARPIDDRPALDQQVRAVRHRHPARTPGPSRRRPRTQAPRTMSGCDRKIRRLMRSSGSSSVTPGIGAANDGSTTIRSASLPASSDPIAVAEPERRRPAQRADPQPVERRQVRSEADARRRERVLRVGPDPHRREDRQVRPARDVRPETDRQARLEVPAERHHPRGEEQVRRRAVGDVRPGLDQPRQLAIREVDRVREHRPLAETAGPVVDVDVVDGLGEEARDLLDLAAVLGDVGLPIGPGRCGKRGGFAQQVGRARDREPRRDGVLQPAVVAAVPALDEPGRLAQGALEDRRGVDRRVVGQPIHHHLADDGPDPVRLGCPERGVQTGLVDRAVDERGRRAGGRERPPGERARAARPRSRRSRARAGRCSARARSAGRARRPGPAFGSCGRWACRSTMPGMTTQGRRSSAPSSSTSGGRSAVGPAKAIRPRSSTTSSPSGSCRVPPASSGVRSRARTTNGGLAGRSTREG